ncbi:hypothetical protein [Pseudomonas sp. PSE14]|uniref:hypothetical protein n=1 Tax=Pseudomonas sp. PSE14 TaxID=3016341 RepID=UPI0023D7D80E|nr:hypothetical protein [Pseudomonas sp. PSE14]WEJ70441.1 hypothetical protein O6P39_17390 [Pseudomonas sp. PSE14]
MELDWFSTTVGFVVGGFTGAVGTYLGDKYTDIRRDKQAKKAQAQQWADIERRYPALIAEMRADLATNEHVRVFFVVKDGLIIAATTEPSFEYCPVKHPNLIAATHHLQELGFITDVTTANTPRYRMTEAFVDLLLRG